MPCGRVKKVSFVVVRCSEHVRIRSYALPVTCVFVHHWSGAIYFQDLTQTRSRMWAAVFAAAVVAAASDVEVYRDPTQPIPARVADLLSRMTLAEKAAQLGCECMHSSKHTRELHVAKLMKPYIPKSGLHSACASAAVGKRRA
jgi:hypothetical protein